ncbi:hypothetical protein N7454_000618 [Penicillium verhagenii]|nr:hypothetical protein N7454_000618 [Penicillium verhagenii]
MDKFQGGEAVSVPRVFGPFITVAKLPDREDGLLIHAIKAIGLALDTQLSWPVATSLVVVI